MSLNQAQLRVKNLLEVWRLQTIEALGYTPDRLDYCCRYNVMHDIFVDRIVAAVPFMRSYEDFCQAAYYWHLLDRYGAEVWHMIRPELNSKKRSLDRSLDSHYQEVNPGYDSMRLDKRIKANY